MEMSSPIPGKSQVGLELVVAFQATYILSWTRVPNALNESYYKSAKNFTSIIIESKIDTAWYIRSYYTRAS